MVKGKGWKLILGSSNSFDSVLGPPFHVRMQGPHSEHSANFRRQKLDKQENAPEIDPRPLAIGEERIFRKYFISIEWKYNFGI